MNSKIQSTNSNLPLSPCVCTPPFCDELLKANQDSSKGGACGVEPLAFAKSAHKAWSSLSASNRSCPCVAWTSITVSSMLYKEESPNVDGGGSIVAVGFTYISAEGSPDEGGLKLDQRAYPLQTTSNSTIFVLKKQFL